jgi:hypothetical protein
VAIAGLAASAGAFLLLRKVSPGWDLSSQIALSSLAYLAPLWPASRLEHRFAAGSRAYRGIRHLWRLGLIGGGIYYFASALGQMRIPLALAGVVAMHFILRNKTLHGEWHNYLDLLWLRRAPGKPPA